MALQISYNDPETQVTAPTCYARIISVTIDVIAQTVAVQVGLYVTAAARQSGADPIRTATFRPPFGALMGGPIDIQVAGYNFLKSLPTFSGAADV